MPDSEPQDVEYIVDYWDSSFFADPRVSIDFNIHIINR
jgi:hypothetical protein